MHETLMEFSNKSWHCSLVIAARLRLSYSLRLSNLACVQQFLCHVIVCSYCMLPLSLAPVFHTFNCFYLRHTISNSKKLCNMLSVTLMIQRPYMAIQENLVACFPWHWRSNNHIWPFRKTSSHAFRETDDPTTVYSRFGILQKTCKVSCSFFIIYTRKMTIQWKLSLVWGSLRLAPISLCWGLTMALLEIVPSTIQKQVENDSTPMEFIFHLATEL